MKPNCSFHSLSPESGHCKEALPGGCGPSLAWQGCGAAHGRWASSSAAAGKQPGMCHCPTALLGPMTTTTEAGESVHSLQHSQIHLQQAFMVFHKRNYLDVAVQMFEVIWRHVEIHCPIIRLRGWAFMRKDSKSKTVINTSKAWMSCLHYRQPQRISAFYYELTQCTTVLNFLGFLKIMLTVCVILEQAQ